MLNCHVGIAYGKKTKKSPAARKMEPKQEMESEQNATKKSVQPKKEKKSSGKGSTKQTKKTKKKSATTKTVKKEPVKKEAKKESVKKEISKPKTKTKFKNTEETGIRLDDSDFSAEEDGSEVPMMQSNWGMQHKYNISFIKLDHI